MRVVCKCGGDEIDLQLDTGTVSKYLRTHGMWSTISAMSPRDGYGDWASWCIRQVEDICISQRQFGDKFKMVNPHKFLVILRGWPHTMYAKREYHFTSDSGDQ